jgi:hypothetical protein
MTAIYPGDLRRSAPRALARPAMLTLEVAS